MAVSLNIPNAAPLTLAERVDLLEANQRLMMQAHNDLADALLQTSLQLTAAMGMLATLTRPVVDDDLPAREPFKRHGKRH